ncbi:glycosyltransferase [Pectobacterium brasiliense]|uniref:glycosyltransferase n=1 Tax=Pectobacterium brasiliense TaxID=180957 RepID=UPI000907B1D2|nr:glycosyltransferase [Pectobacterium brasiliense]
MIIVNLTTISSRLNICSATLWSLINQDKLPDKIILWISKDSHMVDSGIQDIPDFIHQLNKIKNIIEIKFTKNIGPYRKILPALRTCNDDDIIVYADDDVIYSNFWLTRILNKFEENNGKYPVATRVRRITKNFLGISKSYLAYPIIIESEILDSNYIITGVGGCALKKSHINEKYIDLDDYLHIAPKTDDLWISKLLILSNSQVMTCPEALPDIQEILNNYESLSQSNTGISLNNNVFFRLITRVKVKILANLGVPLCGNDVAIKKINVFFKK